MAETKQPTEKKEKTTIVAFSGTGLGLLGYALAAAASGVLAFIPLPLVTVGFRKWFYRNLSVSDSGKPVTISFDGSGVDLLKYWIPSLALLAATGISLVYGISEKTDGFLSFLLIVLSILALLPQAWLWTAKRTYMVAHTRATVGTTPVTFAFSEQGTTALWHGLKMLFSVFAAGIPMPWAIIGAVSWCLGATGITAETTYKPVFSGKGGALFWYGVGVVLSPFFGFLILPSLIRGVMVWAARYTNIVGVERTIEFEFTGTLGRLFGYVYLVIGLCIIGIILNLLLGTAVPEIVRSIIVSAVFVIAIPFIAASFLRWCAANLDVIKR